MLPSVFLHDQRQGSTPECIQILSGERPLNNTQEAACLGPNGAQLFRQCRVYAGSERSHSPHDIVREIHNRVQGPHRVLPVRPRNKLLPPTGTVLFSSSTSIPFSR